MKIIQNDFETLLDNLDYGDTFFTSLDDTNIYIKVYYFDEDNNILCVNIETGDCRFLYHRLEVIPVQCSVSVKA